MYILVIMKLIKGVWHCAAWESSVLYFKSLKSRPNVGIRQRLGECLASEIHVNLALLEEETLEWDYKLKRLITRKDMKQASQLIDMLIEHLTQTPASATILQVAHRLRGTWSHLTHVQSTMLRNDKKQPEEHVLQGIRLKILNDVAVLLEGIKDDCI